MSIKLQIIAKNFTAIKVFLKENFINKGIGVDATMPATIVRSTFNAEDKKYYNGLVPKPKKTLRIVYIVVKDDFQGIGDESKLVECLESEDKPYGMKKPHVNNVIQQAVRFWKKLGYEELIIERET